MDAMHLPLLKDGPMTSTSEPKGVAASSETPVEASVPPTTAANKRGTAVVTCSPTQPCTTRGMSRPFDRPAPIQERQATSEDLRGFLSSTTPDSSGTAYKKLECLSQPDGVGSGAKGPVFSDERELSRQSSDLPLLNAFVNYQFSSIGRKDDNFSGLKCPSSSAGAATPLAPLQGHQLLANNFSRYQRQFTVVEISKGTCRRLFLQTPELLRLVHCHNREKLVDDRSAGSLKLRDLRQICSQSLGSERASIEVRRNCILVNLLKVRCIIMHERLIVLPHRKVGALGLSAWADASRFQQHDSGRLGAGDSAARIIENNNGVLREDEGNLITHLVNISRMRQQSQGPFEFAVLEALLVEVCSYLTDQLLPITREAERISSRAVGNLSSAQHLHEISDLKRQVDSLTDKLRGVSGALQELLNNEEDLRRLELSRFWEEGDTWEHPGDFPPSEDAEILLECYEQEVESMLRQSTRIDEHLDDTLQMIQLHLASIRNAFLKSEIGLDIVGTVVTFVGAVAGIFGMNIPNGYEGNAWVFWPFAQFLIGLCALTCLGTIVLFRRLKL